MVFAPQRLPNTASSTFSIGRERTVFWGICPCSRHGAKTQWRRRYSPRAHRLARLVVLMRSFAMAHSCPPRGIAPLLTLPRSISPGRSSLYSYFSPNACPASWRKKLAAGLVPLLLQLLLAPCQLTPATPAARTHQWHGHGQGVAAVYARDGRGIDGSRVVAQRSVAPSGATVAATPGTVVG